MEDCAEDSLGAALAVTSLPCFHLEDGDEIRARAYATLDRICTLGWPHGGKFRLPQAHRHFARLYFHTTRHWLQSAEAEDEADKLLIYKTVIRFFEAYEECVLRVLTGERPRTRFHWIPYFLMASNDRHEIGALRRWLLVASGILAHIGPDLQRAVFLVRRDADADRSKIWGVLFGKRTDEVFFNATIDYLSSEVNSRQEAISNRTIEAILVSRWIWIRMFQFLRFFAFVRLFFPATNPVRT